MSKKGFTLIELLVVIAIIGILSSIVLVGLRGARNKAQDARIISGLSQTRALAEISYNGADYNALGDKTTAQTCAAAGLSGDLLTVCDDIASQGGNLFLLTNLEYCAYSALKTAAKFWCVDSTGRSKEYAAAPTTCVAGASPAYTCQ